MATPTAPFDSDESLFDSGNPFKGVVVCCTSVPTELRADIAAKTTELGGQHKYDLTPDCTHLIVGDYDTPKYRHVAKERPDVRAMAAGWVEAVRDLWVQDAEIDFLALEQQWQLRAFEANGGEPTADGSEPQRRRLLCCMTGFEDPDERQSIIDKIEANGGVYTGDLTKRVTHLVVNKPEGRKYQAAKNWGVTTVSVEWVNDSVERGLILDEKLYDPVLPRAERGVGAWNKQRPRISALGKRLRENHAAEEEGKRKLRKTASMKLNSQRDNLWGDILGKPQATEPAPAAVSQQGSTNSAASPSVQPTHKTQATQPTQPSGPQSADTQGSKLSSFGVAGENAVFASCCFYVYRFSQQKTEILVNAVASLGGLICHSIDEVVSTSGAQLAHRFLIVPQNSAAATHPQLPENVHIITEFYIERCMHKKYFFDPSEHVIGRPFPLFPIPGFEVLSICTAGFTGVDLNQADKSIRQLGAKYEERFTPNVSLLLCTSLEAVRKQKLELAVAWKVPVVRAEWLWECISAGYYAPINKFLYPELKQDLDGPKVPAQGKNKGKDKGSAGAKPGKASRDGGIDEDLLPRPAVKSKRHQDLDESAFVTAREQSSEPARRRKASSAEHDSNITTITHFETAHTHILPTNDVNISFQTKTLPSGAPLSETSSNSLNKTPLASRKPMSRVTSEVADSEATDGDVDHAGDLPTQQQHDDENAEQRRQPKEENDGKTPTQNDAAQARLEAERLAISTKLATSLLDTTTAKLAAGSGAASAPANSTADAASLPSAPDASAGAGEDGRPRRRKRNIFGRAISNVSAASSTSNNGGDSAVGGGGGGGGVAAVVVGGGDPPPPPPATQLEYEDPEARRHKEQLMSRMMGAAGAGAGTGTGTGTGTGARQEKLTLAEMGGYDLLAQQTRYDAVAGGERRTRRR